MYARQSIPSGREGSLGDKPFVEIQQRKTIDLDADDHASVVRRRCCVSIQCKFNDCVWCLELVDLLVCYLNGALSLMASQLLRDDSPAHRTRRLIAILLAVNDSAYGALNVQTYRFSFVQLLFLLLIALADDQVIQAIQMHQMFASNQRYGWIIRIVLQLFKAHCARPTIRPFRRLDDRHKSADHITVRIHTNN